MTRKRNARPTRRPRTQEELIAVIHAIGWTIEDNGGHLKVRDGTVLVTTLSRTPSDHCAIPNAWTQCMRYRRKQQAA